MEPSKYEEANGEDLAEELRSRGLPVSGTKPEKLQRLKDDDKAKAKEARKAEKDAAKDDGVQTPQAQMDEAALAETQENRLTSGDGVAGTEPSAETMSDDLADKQAEIAEQPQDGTVADLAPDTTPQEGVPTGYDAEGVSAQLAAEGAARAEEESTDDGEALSESSPQLVDRVTETREAWLAANPDATRIPPGMLPAAMQDPTKATPGLPEDYGL